MALPATLEYYEYINSPSSAGIRIGVFAWLTLAVTVVEILICIKFGRRVFTAPWPRHVVWFWAVTGALFCTFMGLWSVRVALRRRHQKAE
jgi:phosphatidylserine synthase 2